MRETKTVSIVVKQDTYFVIVPNHPSPTVEEEEACIEIHQGEEGAEEAKVVDMVLGLNIKPMRY
jgi:hypothetical protein